MGSLTAWSSRNYQEGKVIDVLCLTIYHTLCVYNKDNVNLRSALVVELVFCVTVQIEVDTNHFKGNFPDSCTIEGTRMSLSYLFLLCFNTTYFRITIL